MSKRRPDIDPSEALYEYRVWGRHRRAVQAIEKLADSRSSETVRDCYLILEDDPTWNAKIRDNTLKVKQLVAERKGFEQWASDRLRSADVAPNPFDTIFEQLRLDRPQRGKKYHLADEVEGLDPDSGVRAVFVEKVRRHFRIGDNRAEVTQIEILETGEVLHTVVIEGDDLDELKALRKKLGLQDEDNVAVHQVLDAETAD